MKFLFALWDGGGAVPPELVVARRLIARGHQVRVIADPTLRDQAVGIGAGFVPWDAAPHRTSGTAAEDLVKDWEVRNPMTMLARVRDRLLAGPAAAMAADTAAELTDHVPDAVVADSSCSARRSPRRPPACRSPRSCRTSGRCPRAVRRRSDRASPWRAARSDAAATRS